MAVYFVTTRKCYTCIHHRIQLAVDDMTVSGWKPTISLIPPHPRMASSSCITCICVQSDLLSKRGRVDCTRDPLVYDYGMAWAPFISSLSLLSYAILLSLSLSLSGLHPWSYVMQYSLLVTQLIINRGSCRYISNRDDATNKTAYFVLFTVTSN